MAGTTQAKPISVGRRKNAVARVRLATGTGKITVNGREVSAYFTRPTAVMILRQPLELVERQDALDVMITVRGGGSSGQASAARHGISRALIDLDPGLRPALKKAGMLTRDARKKERKKPGQPGARKRFQYSKR